MKLPRRQFLLLAANAAALPAVSQMARAQTYPVRQITLIVPFPAGGPTDFIARVVAENMRKSLGQTVVSRIPVVPPTAAWVSVGSRARHPMAIRLGSATGARTWSTARSIRYLTIF